MFWPPLRPLSLAGHLASIATTPRSTPASRPSRSYGYLRGSAGGPDRSRRHESADRKCDGGAATMRGIDEPIVLERGERTSLRQLATEGRLTLRRSGSYGSDPA